MKGQRQGQQAARVLEQEQPSAKKKNRVYHMNAWKGAFSRRDLQAIRTYRASFFMDGLDMGQRLDA